MKRENKNEHLDSLGDDLIRYIFSYSDLKSTVSSRRACALFNTAISKTINDTANQIYYTIGLPIRVTDNDNKSIFEQSNYYTNKSRGKFEKEEVVTAFVNIKANELFLFKDKELAIIQSYSLVRNNAGIDPRTPYQQPKSFDDYALTDIYRPAVYTVQYLGNLSDKGYITDSKNRISVKRNLVLPKEAVVYSYMRNEIAYSILKKEVFKEEPKTKKNCIIM